MEPTEITQVGTQIDTSNLRKNQQYNALRQDTSAVNLTNVVLGDVDDLRMSTVQDFENDLGHTLRVRQDDLLGNTGQNLLQGIKQDDSLDSERQNFASAPINSKSALRGNDALR